MKVKKERKSPHFAIFILSPIIILFFSYTIYTFTHTNIKLRTYKRTDYPYYKIYVPGGTSEYKDTIIDGEPGLYESIILKNIRYSPEGLEKACKRYTDTLPKVKYDVYKSKGYNSNSRIVWSYDAKRNVLVTYGKPEKRKATDKIDGNSVEDQFLLKYNCSVMYIKSYKLPDDFDPSKLEYVSQ